VDPVTDPLLLRKSGSAGNQIRTSGSVARNSDNETTEAVLQLDIKELKRYKAPGADGLLAELFKYRGDILNKNL
jgi:hypothetical protein